MGAGLQMEQKNPQMGLSQGGILQWRKTNRLVGHGKGLNSGISLTWLQILATHLLCSSLTSLSLRFRICIKEG